MDTLAVVSRSKGMAEIKRRARKKAQSRRAKYNLTNVMLATASDALRAGRISGQRMAQHRKLAQEARREAEIHEVKKLARLVRRRKGGKTIPVKFSDL